MGDTQEEFADVLDLCERLMRDFDKQLSVRPVDQLLEPAAKEEAYSLIVNTLITIAGIMNATSVWEGVVIEFKGDGPRKFGALMKDFLADPDKTDETMIAVTAGALHPGCKNKREYSKLAGYMTDGSDELVNNILYYAN